MTIPFSGVNDDYCDCADGSDEPGTSACSMGTFHCENVGHQPLDIPSSRVNDGLCDCCDGSDEYATNAACLNDCREKGQAQLKELLKQRELQSQGYALKLEYVRKGKEAKQEQQQKLETVNAQVQEKTIIRDQLKEIKEAAEAPEKEAKDRHQAEWDRIKAVKEMTRAFDMLDSDQDGSISVGELAHNHYLERDMEDHEVKDLLNENNLLLRENFPAAWETLKPIFTKKGRAAPAEEKGPDRKSTV